MKSTKKETPFVFDKRPFVGDAVVVGGCGCGGGVLIVRFRTGKGWLLKGKGNTAMCLFSLKFDMIGENWQHKKKQ